MCLLDGLGATSIKIIDFNVSKQYGKRGLAMITPTGNVFYAAPEVYNEGVYK
jgi:serine/threonine protein kinase